ncbi:MAG: glycosyltransferase family 2 protein [Acidimicrobiales bacterium]
MSSAVVRVVCVTYSPGDVLPAMLDSLPAGVSVPYEVVLADNGSTDGVPEREAVRAEVRLLPTGGNVGYGAAANLGARDADAEWLLVVNPDVVFGPGCLDELLRASQRWPQAGALGPAIRTTEGALYPSARSLPSIREGAGHALFGWIWPSNPWTSAYRRERDNPREGPTGWLSGSCLLVRRAAFEAVGGFDPAYFMYFEDLDLCERLGEARWQSVYVPSALVLHTGGHATQREPLRNVAEHHRSAYRYLSRRYAGWRWAPLRIAIGAGLAARYLLARVLRRVREGAEPARSLDTLPGARDAGEALPPR